MSICKYFALTGLFFQGGCFFYKYFAPPVQFPQSKLSFIYANCEYGKAFHNICKKLNRKNSAAAHRNTIQIKIVEILIGH